MKTAATVLSDRNTTPATGFNLMISGLYAFYFQRRREQYTSYGIALLVGIVFVLIGRWLGAPEELVVAGAVAMAAILVIGLPIAYALGLNRAELEALRSGQSYQSEMRLLSALWSTRRTRLRSGQSYQSEMKRTLAETISESSASEVVGILQQELARLRTSIRTDEKEQEGACDSDQRVALILPKNVFEKYEEIAKDEHATVSQVVTRFAIECVEIERRLRRPYGAPGSRDREELIDESDRVLNSGH